MTTQVRVSIATTAGSIAVERIAPLALRKSKIFTWRGTAPLAAISGSYDEFVAKRVARILPSTHAGSFRIDLSGEIDTGDSWQLAVLTAHALLKGNPNPTREEIVSAISANICRCTGYGQIIEAIQLAAARLAGSNAPAEATR